MAKGLVYYCLALILMSAGYLAGDLSWLIAIAMFALLVWLAVLSRKEGRSLGSLGLQVTARLSGDLLRGLLIGLCLPMGVTVSLIAIGAIVLQPANWPIEMKELVTWGIFLAVVKTALTVSAEEFVFRGYFLGRFQVELGKKAAVAASAALFALVHLPAMIAAEIGPLFVVTGLASWTIFGIGLGLGFLRFNGSLAFPWGLHYGYNFGYSAIAFVITGAIQQPVTMVYQGPEWWTGFGVFLPETGVLGLLLQTAIVLTVLALPGGKALRGHPATASASTRSSTS